MFGKVPPIIIMDERRVSSRRTFFKAGAAIASFEALRRIGIGVSLDSQETIIPLELNTETLLSHDLVAIAHGAANSIDGIKKASQAAIPFADGDLNVIGSEMWLDHGKFVGVRNYTLGGFDRNTLTLRLGDPKLSIEHAFQVAQESEIGLFLETKRGNFDKENLNRIVELSDRYGVPLRLFSHNGADMDLARELTGKDNNCFYAPGSEGEWKDLIFDNLEKGEKRAVLTNSWSVWNYYQLLKDFKKDITVIVMDVNSRQKFAELERYGIVNGYFENIDTLQKLFT